MLVELISDKDRRTSTLVVYVPNSNSRRKTQKGKAGQAMAAKMIPIGSDQSLHVEPTSLSKTDSKFML